MIKKVSSDLPGYETRPLSTLPEDLLHYRLLTQNKPLYPRYNWRKYILENLLISLIITIGFFLIIVLIPYGYNLTTGIACGAYYFLYTRFIDYWITRRYNGPSTRPSRTELPS